MAVRLAGKVAVVTGASKGIGRAVAKLYAAEGAKVLAVFRADRKSAEAAAEEIRAAAGSVSLFQADVSRKRDTDRVADEAIRLYGRIDVLCSNAGVYPAASLESMTEGDWDGVHSINLKGMFLAVKACLPVMQRQRYGKIVVIASTTGTRTGVPGFSHYGATKAGILGFIRCACLELARHNITINAVAPGIIMTEGVREAFGSNTHDFVSEVQTEIPLGRLGDPADVAYAALFLAIDESNYITGQELIVDGAWSCRRFPCGCSNRERPRSQPDVWFDAASQQVRWSSRRGRTCLPLLGHAGLLEMRSRSSDAAPNSPAGPGGGPNPSLAWASTGWIRPRPS